MDRAVLRPETRAAAAAVRAALALARHGPGAVHDKPGRARDVVTDADLAVEDLLRATLGRATGLPVTGEERGGEPPASGAYWLVDPICGTRNFASGLPLYGINVVLVEGGELATAAVGDGTTGQVLVAELGAGAFALEEAGPDRLRASADSQVVVVGAWPDEPARRAAAAFLAGLIRENAVDARVLATTLGLALVATGKVAADVSFATTALHYGAGALLAAEAGATVTDLAGAPFGPASTSLVAAASPALHGELLALVAAAGWPVHGGVTPRP